MEPQQRNYSCGPAAIRAALYMLGRKVREATIRKAANTTVHGTDEKGIIKALHYYGYKTTEIHIKSKREAWSKVKYQVSKGRPVILCINGWSHWVAIVGTFGHKVLVFDPYKEPGKQQSYSGLKPMNERDVLDMWGHEDEDEDIPLTFYGIIVRS